MKLDYFTARGALALLAAACVATAASRAS
ncbi:SCO family protein, partial [Burkholderia mallei]|nr:SCO family protein [Burkholderia mallei]